MRPKNRDGFEIAIICALPLEADAVEALLDETYDRFGRIYKKKAGDMNVYTTGRIGRHNVVLCHLPGMGKGNAASVASSLRISYVNIRLALVVGICGGVPFPSSGGAEIFLGDTIISGSLVEYDFGTRYPGGFQRRSRVEGTPGRPDREIGILLQALADVERGMQFQERQDAHLKELQARDEGRWLRPDASLDIVFEASYQHQHRQEAGLHPCNCVDRNGQGNNCKEAMATDCFRLGCVEGGICRRRSTDGARGTVHVGSIACANTVMKSALHRDRLAETEGVIGFEMEGAGVWQSIPCIVIKAVCDYADSHKNKKWQNYAAATAASGVRSLLEYWTPSDTESNSDQEELETSFDSRADEDFE